MSGTTAKKLRIDGSLDKLRRELSSFNIVKRERLTKNALACSESGKIVSGEKSVDAFGTCFITLDYKVAQLEQLPRRIFNVLIFQRN
jgi:hypothetical protein